MVLRRMGDVRWRGSPGVGNHLGHAPCERGGGETARRAPRVRLESTFFDYMPLVQSESRTS